jgi:NitT/TauT family transport system substrate-binding protein
MSWSSLKVRKSLPLRFTAITALVLVVSMASIAGSAGARVHEPAATSAPAAKSQSTRPKLSVVGFGNALTWYLPLTWAQSRGFFRRAGVDVTFIPAASNAESLAAIISRRAHIALFSMDQVVTLRRQGVPVKAMVASTQGPLNSIIVRSDVDARPGVIGDLRGLRIGVPGIGGSGDLNLRTWLQAGGLEPGRDVSIVGIGGGGPGLIAALRSGQVDGVLGFSPFSEQIVHELGIGKYVIDPLKRQGSGLFWPGSLPWNIFLGREDHFKHRRAQAVAFVRGLAAAVRDLRARPGAATQFSTKLYPLFDREDVLTPATANLTKVLGPKIPRKRLRNIVSWMRITGTLKPGETLVYDDLVFKYLEPHWAAPPAPKKKAKG